MDSIAASQAVDPGSIPGQCSKVSSHLLVLVAEPMMYTRCNVPKFGSSFSDLPIKSKETMHDIVILQIWAHYETLQQMRWWYSG